MICERLALVSVVLLFSACGVDSMAEHPCGEQGTALSYEGFGQGFLEQHCQSCHGAAGPERRGAPLAYDFSTQEQARGFSERIFERAAMGNTTMPPGPDDPPLEERMKLGEWLSCGAP